MERSGKKYLQNAVNDMYIEFVEVVTKRGIIVRNHHLYSVYQMSLGIISAAWK